MLKIAVVGMERIGKTTLIHEAIGILQKWKVECLFLPEITMHPHNINLDLWAYPMQQRLLIFDQMVQEDRLMLTNLKDILITDRSPFDALLYYEEVATNELLLYNKTVELVREWMKTYDLIIYYNALNPVSKPNKHFKESDLAAWNTRAQRFDEGITNLVQCNIYITETLDGELLAQTINTLCKESL